MDNNFEISKEEINDWLKNAFYCVYHINKIEDVCESSLPQQLPEDTNYDIIIEQLEYLYQHGKRFLDPRTLSDIHEVISIVYRCMDHWVNHKDKYISLSRCHIDLLLDFIRAGADKLGYNVHVIRKDSLPEYYKNFNIVFINKESKDKFAFE